MGMTARKPIKTGAALAESQSSTSMMKDEMGVERTTVLMGDSSSSAARKRAQRTASDVPVTAASKKPIITLKRLPDRLSQKELYPHSSVIFFSVLSGSGKRKGRPARREDISHITSQNMATSSFFPDLPVRVLPTAINSCKLLIKEAGQAARPLIIVSISLR
jgi:hypothetical protein